MEIDIHDYLKQFSQQAVTYIPNPGNAGDSLIATATYFLFDKHHIKYVTQFSDEEIQKIKRGIVFYGGGGNLVRYYYSGDKIIRNIVNNCDKLIILPHTIEGHFSLLHNLPDHVEILCREFKSYQYIKSIGIKNVYLCDDLAFFFDYNQWIKKSQKNIGNCFRIDREKTNLSLKQDNIDISESLTEIKFEGSMEKFHKKRAFAFIEHIANYKIINTNRLHVAIVAAKLGKKVNFYPNSYWKNAAVYDFSMKNKYRNVKFISKGKQDTTINVQSDGDLSSNINQLFNAQFSNTNLKDKNQAQQFLILSIAAWNYAITKSYSIFKGTLEHPNNRNSLNYIEFLLTELVEKKELLFPNDNRVITHYQIIPTEMNSLQLKVNFQN